jgi:ABC-type sugar transport system ATPase subunit
VYRALQAQLPSRDASSRNASVPGWRAAPRCYEAVCAGDSRPCASGSGKSTVLRLLAGLEDLTDGEIRVGAKDVTRTPPKDRDIAMVFQNYALYPHMSVAENMAFALKLKGVPKSERMAKVRDAAKLLDLEDYLDRRPKALSGGQRQRVAMGRALVRHPSVFLMDEPLSNLDAKLRVETRSNIAALQARLGTTTIYVTHDQVEAMTMGHRAAVLHGGVLQQVDTPRNLYDRPVNAFVAGFIGSPAMNLRSADLADRGARLGNIVVRLSEESLSAARAAGLTRTTLGLRPESCAVTADRDDPSAAAADAAGLRLRGARPGPQSRRQDGARGRGHHRHRPDGADRVQPLPPGHAGRHEGNRTGRPR